MLFGTAPKRVLDLSKHNPTLDPLISTLENRIVGQPEVVKTLADIVEGYLSGLGDPTRPAGNALFLGPTGTGKTRSVEAMCEGLVGDPRACIKIDCAEFQHSHEIAKLIGSPPGYLGHRETHPILTQEALSKFHKPGFEFSVLLFDEIEKASDSLWQLMLGILDKATLTLGDNRVVNFQKVAIIMTSNLGGKEMSQLLTGGYGFKQWKPGVMVETDDVKNTSIAVEAAKKHFTPEFMNRIDHTVVFKTLTRPQIQQIMMIELGLIQSVMLEKALFVYQLTDAAKAKLMEEGYSVEYGARNLKRSIESRVRLPLARLVSSGQIAPGDAVVVDEVGDSQFEFSIQNLSQTKVTFKDLADNIL
jgi:ATP-dependent Clp protease ATP-binding subunit ClpA